MLCRSGADACHLYRGYMATHGDEGSLWWPSRGTQSHVAVTPFETASTCANHPDASTMGTAEWAARAGGAPSSYAPFVLTTDAQVDRIIALARITSRDIVCDLGFGDAQVLLRIAERTHCTCIGNEVNGDLVARARDRAAAAGDAGSRLTLTQGLNSVFVETAAFLTATVIFLALVPSSMEELVPMIHLALERPGVRVVSQRFEAPGLKAAASIDGGGATSPSSYFSDCGPAYLYERAATPAPA